MNNTYEPLIKFKRYGENVEKVLIKKKYGQYKKTIALWANDDALEHARKGYKLLRKTVIIHRIVDAIYLI